MKRVPSNENAASMLRDCADLLRQQDANPFRVNACNHAAQTLEALPEDARDILRDEGLVTCTGIVSTVRPSMNP